MKLAQHVINNLKNNKRARARLQLALDRSEYRINDYIKDNESNGELTKAIALQVIKEETGFSDDEILEADPETVRNTAA
jgi:hypothetical protein